MSSIVFNNNQKTTVLSEQIVTQGTYPSDAQSSSSIFPLGMLRFSAFNYATNSSGEQTDGAAVNIVDNQSLFVVLGITYGGDGNSTFDVPDTSGRVLVGKTSSTFLGTTEGTETETLTQSQYPADLGGSSAEVNNIQPSLSINYLIRISAPTDGSQGFIGEVDAFAGNQIPGGFALANGQLLSVANNKALFAVIGNTYGGDGVHTFALPDLSGRNIVGASSTTPLGSEIGNDTITVSDSNIKSDANSNADTIDNRSAGLALNYIICTSGAYPGTLSDDSYLGEVRAFAGPVSKIPSGWQLANGALLSIGQNQALFSLLGTTYGGDGVSTFALPDLSDSTVAGSSSTSTVGTVYGLNQTLLEVVCFLAGSMINTPSGCKAVEDLTIGDQIVTFDWRNKAEVLQAVSWVGTARCYVRSDLPDDRAGWPVRIVKDAFAKGVPFKDMLITAEHCLFFKGHFLPVRMLVNNRSIFYDKSINSYDYYHIETEKHAVITADGVLTESYLDTGNRHIFRQTGKVVSIAGRQCLSWDHAAAPLDVSAAFAEPLFRQTEARAISAGHSLRNPESEHTEHPDLCLKLGSGAMIMPVREHNGCTIFLLPAGVENIRLISRAARPSDVIGPFIDDRRYFGVEIGEITLFENKKSCSVSSHLTGIEMPGWHSQVKNNSRWTSGDALLPSGVRSSGCACLLSVQIINAGPYLVNEVYTGEYAFHPLNFNMMPQDALRLTGL